MYFTCTVHVRYMYSTCTLHVHFNVRYMYILMYIRSLQNVHFNARCKCTFVVHYNVHSNVHYNVHAWLYIQCTFDVH